MGNGVICSVCEKTFDPLFAGSRTQADGCASEVIAGSVIGHYGSSVADLLTLRFVGGGLQDGSVICDDCLTTMIADGRLEYSGSYAPGEAVDPRIISPRA